MQLLILGVVFIATLSLLVGGFIFVNRRRLAAAASARARLKPEEETAAHAILKEESISDLPLLNRILAGRSFAEELGEQLQRAGSTLTAGGFLLLTIGSALVGLLIGVLSGRPVTIVAGIGIGYGFPFFWLRRKIKKRQHAFETQLPEAIDMLVTSMRAGYSFQAAMRFIGQEMPAPLGTEFTRFYDEQRLGVDVRSALLAMQERVASLDFKMLVTAVLIQRETGGSLGDILANIATLMRERVAVRAQIQTLTAEPKLSARILAALPVVVYLGLSVVNPEYVQPLTTTELGKAMLIVAAVAVSIGYFILMRFADVDF